MNFICLKDPVLKFLKFLSNRVLFSMENEVLVTDDREVADMSNEYCIHITEALGIHEPNDILTSMD